MYTCKYCKKVFETKAQLAGHSNHCKLKPKTLSYSDADKIIDKIQDYLFFHTQSEACNHFNISTSLMYKLIKEKKLKIPTALEKAVRSISKEDLTSYYREFGRSASIKHFSIGINTFDALVNHYGIERTKEEINTTRKQTCLLKYGTEHPMNVKSIANKQQESFLSNYESPQSAYKERNHKRAQTLISKHGTIEEAYQKRNEKTYQSIIENYGSIEKFYDMIFTIRRNNGTLNSSQPEEDMFNFLITKFNTYKILRNYKDIRYPFHSDFYIKDLDLFIELNFHPSHGDHPFDENNEKDVALLHELSNSSSDWDRQISYVWGDLDVRKSKLASYNNLNYLVIYDIMTMYECVETMIEKLSEK